MKSKSTDQKKEFQDMTVITEKNLDQFPESFREGFELLQVTEKKILAQKKYMSTQKSLIRQNLKALQKTSPDMPVKKVIVRQLQQLPDFLPANMIIDLTRFISNEWKKLDKKSFAA